MDRHDYFLFYHQQLDHQHKQASRDSAAVSSHLLAAGKNVMAGRLGLHKQGSRYAYSKAQRVSQTAKLKLHTRRRMFRMRRFRKIEENRARAQSHKVLKNNGLAMYDPKQHQDFHRHEVLKASKLLRQRSEAAGSPSNSPEEPQKTPLPPPKIASYTHSRLLRSARTSKSQVKTGAEYRDVVRRSFAPLGGGGGGGTPSMVLTGRYKQFVRNNAEAHQPAVASANNAFHRQLRLSVQRKRPLSDHRGPVPLLRVNPPPRFDPTPWARVCSKCHRDVCLQKYYDKGERVATTTHGAPNPHEQGAGSAVLAFGSQAKSSQFCVSARVQYFSPTGSEQQAVCPKHGPEPALTASTTNTASLPPESHPPDTSLTPADSEATGGSVSIGIAANDSQMLEVRLPTFVRQWHFLSPSCKILTRPRPTAASFWAALSYDFSRGLPAVVTVPGKYSTAATPVAHLRGSEWESANQFANDDGYVFMESLPWSMVMNKDVVEAVKVWETQRHQNAAELNEGSTVDIAEVPETDAHGAGSVTPPSGGSVPASAESSVTMGIGIVEPVNDHAVGDQLVRAQRSEKWVGVGVKPLGWHKGVRVLTHGEEALVQDQAVDATPQADQTAAPAGERVGGGGGVVHPYASALLHGMAGSDGAHAVNEHGSGHVHGSYGGDGGDAQIAYGSRGDHVVYEDEDELSNPSTASSATKGLFVKKRRGFAYADGEVTYHQMQQDAVLRQRRELAANIIRNFQQSTFQAAGGIIEEADLVHGDEEAFLKLLADAQSGGNLETQRLLQSTADILGSNKRKEIMEKAEHAARLLQDVSDEDKGTGSSPAAPQPVAPNMHVKKRSQESLAKHLLQRFGFVELLGIVGYDKTRGGEMSLVERKLKDGLFKKFLMSAAQNEKGTAAGPHRPGTGTNASGIPALSDKRLGKGELLMSGMHGSCVSMDGSIDNQVTFRTVDGRCITTHLVDRLRSTLKADEEAHDAATTLERYAAHAEDALQVARGEVQTEATVMMRALRALQRKEGERPVSHASTSRSRSNSKASQRSRAGDFGGMTAKAFATTQKLARKDVPSRHRVNATQDCVMRMRVRSRSSLTAGLVHWVMALFPAVGGVRCVYFDCPEASRKASGWIDVYVRFWFRQGAVATRNLTTGVRTDLTAAREAYRAGRVPTTEDKAGGATGPPRMQEVVPSPPEAVDSEPAVKVDVAENPALTPMARVIERDLARGRTLPPRMQRHKREPAGSVGLSISLDVALGRQGAPSGTLRSVKNTGGRNVARLVQDRIRQRNAMDTTMYTRTSKRVSWSLDGATVLCSNLNYFLQEIAKGEMAGGRHGATSQALALDRFISTMAVHCLRMAAQALMVEDGEGAQDSSNVRLQDTMKGRLRSVILPAALADDLVAMLHMQGSKTHTQGQVQLFERVCRTLRGIWAGAQCFPSSVVQLDHVMQGRSKPRTGLFVGREFLQLGAGARMLAPDEVTAAAHTPSVEEEPTIDAHISPAKPGSSVNALIGRGKPEEKSVFARRVAKALGSTRTIPGQATPRAEIQQSFADIKQRSPVPAPSAQSPPTSGMFLSTKHGDEFEARYPLFVEPSETLELPPVRMKPFGNLSGDRGSTLPSRFKYDYLGGSGEYTNCYEPELAREHLRMHQRSEAVNNAYRILESHSGSSMGDILRQRRRRDDGKRRQRYAQENRTIASGGAGGEWGEAGRWTEEHERDEEVRTGKRLHKATTVREQLYDTTRPVVGKTQQSFRFRGRVYGKKRSDASQSGERGFNHRVYNGTGLVVGEKSAGHTRGASSHGDADESELINNYLYRIHDIRDKLRPWQR